MQIKVNFVFECIEKQTVGEFVKNSLAIQFDRSEFSEQKILQYSNLTYEMYKFLIDLRQSLNNGESSRMNQRDKLGQAFYTRFRGFETRLPAILGQGRRTWGLGGGIGRSVHNNLSGGQIMPTTLLAPQVFRTSAGNFRVSSLVSISVKHVFSNRLSRT